MGLKVLRFFFFFFPHEGFGMEYNSTLQHKVDILKCSFSVFLRPRGIEVGRFEG